MGSLAVDEGVQLVGIATDRDRVRRGQAGDLADPARPVASEVIFSHHDSPVPNTT